MAHEGPVIIFGDANKAAEGMIHLLINTESLNTKRVHTCASTRYHDRFATTPDICTSNIAFDNPIWGIPKVGEK